MATESNSETGGKLIPQRHSLEDGIFEATATFTQEAGRLRALAPASATASDAQNSSEPSKRQKMEYLAFRGSRHTRVGSEYQVAALPLPPVKTSTAKAEHDDAKDPSGDASESKADSSTIEQGKQEDSTNKDNAEKS